MLLRNPGADATSSPRYAVLPRPKSHGSPSTNITITAAAAAVVVLYRRFAVYEGD